MYELYVNNDIHISFKGASFHEALKMTLRFGTAGDRVDLVSTATGEVLVTIEGFQKIYVSEAVKYTL